MVCCTCLRAMGECLWCFACLFYAWKAGLCKVPLMRPEACTCQLYAVPCLASTVLCIGSLDLYLSAQRVT